MDDDLNIDLNIDLELLQITQNFNDEVIWDNQKDLFSIYYKNTFFKDRFRLSLYEIDDLTFDDAMDCLSYI